MSDGKVWVVWGSRGDYSDYVTWIAGAFSTESAAEAWATLAARAARRDREIWIAMEYDHPTRLNLERALPKETGDPRASIDADWQVEALTVDALAIYIAHGSAAPST